MFSVQFYVGSAVEWHFRPYNTGGFPGRIAQKARAKVQAKVQSCVCAGVVSAASIYQKIVDILFRYRYIESYRIGVKFHFLSLGVQIE